ncbi:histidine kinase [Virgisporangium aliadipatigenens]|uniref:histidine kinase n=1 Tax=Virgisporangium aliadipatigenens TaxID=741659 RepID=A0A8J3YIY8_9ACTN|nr:sensor histidine kinase [Virgisporangium aliadipatigenens]GIJ46174.1 histidine kinase [Virgisporangium aliadipatigenens]
MTVNPLRLLASSSPWRAIGYLLSGWVVAAVWIAAVLALLVVPALGLAVLFAGIPFGAVERARLRLVEPRPRAVSPHGVPTRDGVWSWLATRFREPATWRELGYALLFSLALAWVDATLGLLALTPVYVICYPLVVAAFPEFQPDALFGLVPTSRPGVFAATPLGLLLLPPALYLITAYASVRARLTRFFLSDDGTGTDRRVSELSRSRERILDAMDAQRRRIERDLHDGAQQRLTGLIMSLGVARLHLADGPPPAREAVDRAYRQARTALAELRELVHGIHPQVLTNRGLAPAVAELAERCTVPVEVRIDLPDRPPEHVEAAAWFIIGEALTNIARHSAATRAWVSCRRVGAFVRLEIRDDGVGGASPDRGTGLVGLNDRVSVLRGRFTVDSPTGGPTTLRAELPCAS